METLLKPGDMIRIRSDIEQGTSYAMILDSDVSNSWIKDDMIPAGTLVEIAYITDKQYVVHAISPKRDQKLYDDEFWLYTDQMFDPELLNILLEDRYNF